MKRIYIYFILLAVIFQGCIDYYQKTTLKTDGSGDMFVHYTMRVATAQDSVMMKEFGLFDADSLRNVFTANFNTINNVEVYFDGNDSTMHGKIEFEFVHIDSLNQIKFFRDSNFSLKNGAAGQKIFSQFVPPVATGFGIDPKKFAVTYIYYIPGDIVTHNAHNKDVNVLTWKYDLSEIGTGKTLTTTFRPFKLKETPVWIYILAFSVLLIVIIFLFKKNK